MEKHSQASIWNNPMIQEAKKSLSPADIEKYKNLGESLYRDIDYEKSTIDNNLPPFVQNATSEIISMIKSGLHISDLETSEKELLSNIYGKEWYKKFGFIEADLYDIVTIPEEIEVVKPEKIEKKKRKKKKLK